MSVKEMNTQTIFIVGTRAQLIKVAPVIREFERLNLPCIMLLTGQHQETIQELIDEFGIRIPQQQAVEPAENSTIAALILWLPRAYRSIKSLLQKTFTDYRSVDVLVHGDTLSTLIGAYAAHRCGARVVHLESGLTSGKLFDPFPEELLRRLVFRFTNIAMCPNNDALYYMHRRYPSVTSIATGGNTILDAVAMSGATAVSPNFKDPYIVVTLHRFQNIYFTSRLKELVALIEAVAKQFHVFFILHPTTRNRLAKTGMLEQLSANPKVNLCARMGYSKFLCLAAGAACVLTDGGSNQEELAVLGVPTIIMRKYTERPDGLGKNAILEREIKPNVQSYILSGGFERLRQAPAMIEQEGPSRRILMALRQQIT